MTDSANLDLVRSIYADWERGDFSRADWADHEIEFDVIGFVGAPEPTKGVVGMAKGSRAFLTAWEDYRVEADEYRELDSQRVLVLVHDAGRGKVSGVDLASIKGERAMLFCVRDGKVTRLVLYWDRDRAFADLGPAPEADSAT